MSLIIDDKAPDDSPPEICDENGEPVAFDEQPDDIEPNAEADSVVLNRGAFFRSVPQCN